MPRATDKFVLGYAVGGGKSDHFVDPSGSDLTWD
jgi:hypothetical protein